MMLAPRAVKRKGAPAQAAAAIVESTKADGAEDDGSTASASAEIQLAASPNGVHPEVKTTVGAGLNEEPVASTSQIVPQSEEVEDHSERLALLRFTIEESLSDWGLSSQHPDLRAKLQASDSAFVHISNLLSLPRITKQTSSMADITKALREKSSKVVELDETGFQVRRKGPIDFEYLQDTTVEDWTARSLYLENVPLPPKGQSKSLESMRSYFEELFETSIDVVRFPELYSPSPFVAESRSQAGRGETGLFAGGQISDLAGLGGRSKGSNQQNKQNHRKIVIPENGGNFKGFAFVVMRDVTKAEQALQDWSWEKRGEQRAEAHTFDVPDAQNHFEIHQNASQEPIAASENIEQEAQGATSSVKSSALKSGMCAMRIQQFNELRLEYLRYMRDLTTLREAQEKTREAFSSRRRRSISPVSRKRAKWRSASPDELETPRKSPSPDRWQRKALSPSPEARPVRTYADMEDEFPRGCVCFVKRFRPETSTRTLKTLFQAILEQEEIDPELIQFVDHSRNVDSCHVRFSDAVTASFFASYFAGSSKYSHVDATSTDPAEALKSQKKDATGRPMEVEVMTGTPEAIYWSKVPHHARKPGVQAEAVLPEDVGEPGQNGTTSEAVVRAVKGLAENEIVSEAQTVPRKRQLSQSEEGSSEHPDQARPDKQTRLSEPLEAPAE